MIWNKKLKKRIIGLYGDLLSDNLVIAMGGVHGNEPAGVEAIRQVVDYLQDNQVPTKGCFLGIKGNMAALETGARYIDKDLNRLWYDKQIEHVRTSSFEDLKESEDKEQKEILFLLEQFLSHRETENPFLFIDLHTTSAENGFFSIVNDNPDALELSKKLNVPFVKGLTSVLTDTSLEMFSNRKYAAIAFEAGHHKDPSSIERMKAILLLALHTMGIVALSIYEIEKFNLILFEAGKALPKETSFSYRHSIHSQDKFEMKSGFKNFDPVNQGQELARDQEGKVFANEDGYILMPLYQKQGSDGFFIVK